MIAGHRGWNGYPYFLDIERLQEFFASKGYKFVPGFGDQPNVFYGPDGLPYGNDYMCMLIKEGKI